MAKIVNGRIVRANDRMKHFICPKCKGRVYFHRMDSHECFNSNTDAHNFKIRVGF